jgi:hypothetical protein
MHPMHPGRAVSTPIEREYRHAFLRAKRRWTQWREPHRIAGCAGCARCWAELLRFAEVLDHQPCRTCRGIGKGCPDCQGSGWLNGPP